MSDPLRPFLLYVTRDAENRAVVKIQGDGIPVTEMRLTPMTATRYAHDFAQAAIDLLQAEAAASKTGHSRG